MSKNKPKRKPHAQSSESVPSAQGLTDAGTRRELWMMVVLGLFTFALYANTLGHGFVFDDTILIHGNKFTQRGIAGIPKC